MLELEPNLTQSLWVLIFVLSVVFAGSVVQAGLGMGFGLTVAPILALVDPALVPVSALFLGTATAFLGALSERTQIIWKEVGIGMTGRMTGILVGVVVLLEMTSREMFSLVFGTIILFAVILSVAGWRLAFTMRNLLAMGLISGFTGVITSVGAPPLALIYQNQPAHRTRATLATFFAIGGAASLTVLYATGWANLSHIWLALIMAPAAIMGTWVGRRIRGQFDNRYRIFLLAIAGIASFMLIARGLL